MTVELETKNSTHRVEIVPVTLEKHPGADTLSIVPIFGYVCVVKTQDWAGITKAAYCPPDSVVSVSRPEFAFLAPQAKADGKVRIKAKKLRGVISYGLMVPVPDDTLLGEDWAERLGVEHYVPEERGAAGRGGLFMGGEVAIPPSVYFVKYDLEAGRRYSQQLFTPGEPVVVSEKIHGASMRAVYSGDKMHVGSRGEWKKEYPDYSHVTVDNLVLKGVPPEKAQEVVDNLHSKPRSRNLWWVALDNTPSLKTFCENHPDVVVYGEVYGSVQDLNYGHQKGQVSFRAFDMMVGGQWMHPEGFFEMCARWGVPHVPLLNKFKVLEDDIGVTGFAIEPIPYDFDTICAMAEGQSLIADHVREGVVVKPMRERQDPRLGRVALKWIGGGYLERSK